MEQPLLRLGMLGFTDPVGLRVQAWATEERDGWPRWRCCDPHVADAWMINGAAVEVLGRDEVVIHHPFGSERRLTLNRSEVDRPLAFATPLPEGFASAEFFDAADELSVRQRLHRFEAWLRPLRSQFALGAVIARHKRPLTGVVQLRNEGKLLAVLDFVRWQVGISVPARPVELSVAKWVEQPVSESSIPSMFLRLPLHKVMWSYAVRTATDVLPPRYRTETIYLRRIPLLPARWFGPEHLLLMRVLSSAPCTFEELLRRTGMDAIDLAHHLSGLFHAGGLTTDHESARRAEREIKRSINLLQFDNEDTDIDQSNRFKISDQVPPSTILREAQHSPLRTSNRSA